jgi:hypothetical protein
VRPPKLNLSPLVRRVLSAALGFVVVFAVCWVFWGPGFMAWFLGLVTFAGMAVSDRTSPGSD